MTREERREQYLQKLRDPRWQKMRLQIMQRDEFTCQQCGDSKSTLHVHHNYYESGKDPWDYPMEALVTLCEACHEIETTRRREQEEALLEVLRRIGMKADHVCNLARRLDNTFGIYPQFSDYDECAVHLFFLHFVELLPDVMKLQMHPLSEFRVHEFAGNAEFL